MPKKAAPGAFAGTRVIRTKLGPPRPSRRTVVRAALHATLALGGERAITVLRAPAGFGKTTILSDWREHLLAESRVVAWITLDADDNDPSQFVACLSRALLESLGRLADHAPELQADFGGASPKVALTSIINALESVGVDLTLILDDYDRIQASGVHDLLAFLILHAPSNLHLMLATRSEPPLPLAYLRAHDELVEIDAGGMRFGIEETKRFLNEIVALKLDAGQVRALHDATEGWVAGLQIAAIALRGRSDPARLIAGFSGKSQAINEYLADAVLPSFDRQTVDFLLRTSILERLTGPLCGHLAGGGDATLRLKRLTQQNLFLLALDDEGRWYRHHALFGDFLRTQLLMRYPDEVRRLHERAAYWFAGHELWSEAVRHALASDHPELATQWVEHCAMREVEDSRVHVLLAWVRKLPESAVRPRLRLRIAVAWALLLTIQLDQALAIVEDLDAGIAAAEFERTEQIDAELLALRFCITALKDDTRSALLIGERCLARFAERQGDDAHAVWRAQALLNGLTHCYERAGRLDRARAVQQPESYPVACDPTHKLFTHSYRASTLGACDVHEARLHDCAHKCREALQLAETHAGRRSAAAALVAAPLAAIHYEWNQFDEVDQLLADRLDIVDDACYLDSVRLAYLSLARLFAARGDFEAAHGVLERAELVAARRRWPRLTVVSLAERVRLWLAEARTAETRRGLLRMQAVLKAADTRGNADPELGEMCWVARARWLLQDGETAEAILLLKKRLKSGTASGAYRSLTPGLLLATALHLAGREREAMARLAAVMRIAESAQAIRSLLDEGPSTAKLLAAWLETPAGRRTAATAWGKQLRAALRITAAAVRAAEAHETAPRGESMPVLVEALSQRERDVLSLVAQGLSNEQTGRALRLSTETVKWHLKNIYTKLGVKRRTLAVYRARQMELIAETV